MASAAVTVMALLRLVMINKNADTSQVSYL